MDAPATCPQCGAALPEDILQGLCPKCVARQAASILVDLPSSPVVAEPGTFVDPGGIIQPTEQPGDHIGRYKLLQKIGEGGCGIVYMAEQEEPVRRRVALKVIKLGMDTRSVIARFEAERQALALMDHPNIAKVLDAGATDTGRPYFIMELVKGIRITDYCDQNNISPRERLDLFIRVCSAIQHAHQKGIIHRDIKPSNVLVTLHDGVPVPKVIDFGIAKATEGRLTDKTLFTAFEQMIGTPAYMSPEQAEMSGLDIDTRSDIYALGVLLYELLTGKTPFDAKDLLASGIDAMRKTIREQEPVRPSTRLSTMLQGELTVAAWHRHTDAPKLVHLIRGDLDWIVMKCLEKDRGRRYDTANGLAMDLKRHLNNEAVVARPPSTAYRFQKAFRRNKLIFFAAATVTVALVLGATVSTWQAIQATRAKREQSRLRELADRALSDEATERQKAERAREQAETNARIARQNLYAADMSLAQQAMKANSLGRARRLLDRHRPRSGEQDLRGWEWRYLWSRCRSHAIATLARHGEYPIASTLSFSADGKLLAVGFSNGRLDVWDVPGRTLISVLQTNGSSGKIRFSPRGHLLAQLKRSSIGLYDLAARVPPVELELGDNGVRAFAFSRDGSLLVCVNSTKPGFQVVDVDRRAIIATNLPVGFDPDRSCGDVRLSPAGKRLYAAITRGLAGPRNELSVRVFGAQDEAFEHQFVVGHDELLWAMDLSPDGRFLATGSGYEQSNIRVWDALTFKLIAQLDTHTAWIPELSFSPDGHTLASASADETVRLWDTETWSERAVLRGHGAEVWSVAFTADGKLLASGAKDGEVLLWSTDELPASNDRFAFPDRVHSAAFLPGEPAILTVSANEQCSVWRLPALTETLLPFAPGSIQLFVPEELHNEKVSPDGKLEAVPSSSGIATIQNAETHERLVTLRGHLLAVDGVAFAPDGKRLATTSGGKEAAKIWDTATWQELLNLEGEGMNLYQAEFSEDGNVLLVGWRYNGFWQLWRAPSWHEIEDIERNGGGWPRNEE